MVPGLNEPTTPMGRPERLTVTDPVNPFFGVMVRALFALAPRAMLRAAGETDKLNVGGATASEMVTLLVRLPEVPVMVTVEVLAGALTAAVNVILLLLAVLAGEKTAVTPLGSPDAVSATVPVKPFTALMPMALVPLRPGARPTLPGVDVSVKFGGAVMVTGMVTVLFRLPEVPVIVAVHGVKATVLDAVKVTVLLLGVLAGEKDAVTPLGIPAAASATVPVNPPEPLMAMALVMLIP